MQITWNPVRGSLSGICREWFAEKIRIVEKKKSLEKREEADKGKHLDLLRRTPCEVPQRGAHHTEMAEAAKLLADEPPDRVVALKNSGIWLKRARVGKRSSNNSLNHKEKRTI